MKLLKFLCVPFEPEREVFDDEAVRACLRHHELITAETHFFTQQGRAYWALALEVRVYCLAALHGAFKKARRAKRRRHDHTSSSRRGCTSFPYH